MTLLEDLKKQYNLKQLEIADTASKLESLKAASRDLQHAIDEEESKARAGKLREGNYYRWQECNGDEDTWIWIKVVSIDRISITCDFVVKTYRNNKLSYYEVNYCDFVIGNSNSFNACILNPEELEESSQDEFFYIMI